MSTKATAATTIVQIDANEKEVACDGGGALGHPLVYLPIGDKSYIVCYYCGRRFEKKQPKS